MSRIGKKPIPLPSGVKFDVAGSTVVVQGPKGKVTTHRSEEHTSEPVTRSSRMPSSSAGLKLAM